MAVKSGSLIEVVIGVVAVAAVIFFSIVSRLTFCCCSNHIHSLSNMLTVFM